MERLSILAAIAIMLALALMPGLGHDTRSARGPAPQTQAARAI